jgi:hypothetical protein
MSLASLRNFVHGLAARHEASVLRRIESGQLLPARKVLGLHVQRGQVGGTFGELPVPQVAILHVAHHIRRGACGWKNSHASRAPDLCMSKNTTPQRQVKPSNWSAALLWWSTARAWRPAPRWRAAVRVQTQSPAHRPCGLAGAAGRPRSALGHIQAQALHTAFIKRPGRQSSGKAIGAPLPWYSTRIGIVAVWGDQQLQWKKGSHARIVACHRRPNGPRRR